MTLKETSQLKITSVMTTNAAKLMTDLMSSKSGTIKISIKKAPIYSQIPKNNSIKILATLMIINNYY